MKISGIYKIQSKIKPERIYIGSAVNIAQRWRTHLSGLKLNKHENRKLQNHYNKYGELDLVFIILEPCFPQFLIIKEQHYLNKLKPYFNIYKIAGSPLGIIRSKESIQKRVDKCRDQKRTKETRQIMRENSIGENNPNYGKHPSEETRRKMSKGRLGKHHSEKTKQKQRESHKGLHWHLSEKTKQKMRKPKSEESKLKNRLSHLGKKDSEETRTKKSKSAEKAWKSRKLKNQHNI